MIHASTATLVGQILADPQVNTQLHTVLVNLLTLVVTAVATLAGALIKSKLNSSNSDWKQKLAFRVVCFAEQRYADNAEKRSYVSGQIAKLIPGVTQEEADHLLEEAVVKLKATQSGDQPSAAAPSQGA